MNQLQEKIRDAVSVPAHAIRPASSLPAKPLSWERGQQKYWQGNRHQSGAEQKGRTSVGDSLRPKDAHFDDRGRCGLEALNGEGPGNPTFVARPVFAPGKTVSITCSATTS